MKKKKVTTEEKEILTLNLGINFLAAHYASYVSFVDKNKTNNEKPVFFDTFVKNYILETNEEERKYLLSNECIHSIVCNYEKKTDYLKEDAYYKNKLS